ncbi:MAG: isopeptide-forming domain-containing fimbrial protein [Coriobacteriales bacterium]|nr:isopeptide-forming domain-containing fimbrial protein [Coriobacteriales bacterium]
MAINITLASLSDVMLVVNADAATVESTANTKPETDTNESNSAAPDLIDETVLQPDDADTSGETIKPLDNLDDPDIPDDPDDPDDAEDISQMNVSINPSSFVTWTTPDFVNRLNVTISAVISEQYTSGGKIELPLDLTPTSVSHPNLTYGTNGSDGVNGTNTPAFFILNSPMLDGWIADSRYNKVVENYDLVSKPGFVIFNLKSCSDPGFQSGLINIPLVFDFNTQWLYCIPGGTVLFNVAPVAYINNLEVAKATVAPVTSSASNDISLSSIEPANPVFSNNPAGWKTSSSISDFVIASEKPVYFTSSDLQAFCFTITFTLPNDVSSYQSLRVEDAFPSSILAFANATLTVDGISVATPIVDSSVAGRVSFILNAQELSEYAGQAIEYTLVFGIPAMASGHITNHAALYISSLDGLEPDSPDAEYQLIVYNVAGITDFTKTHSGAFSAIDDAISFTVGFNLPEDATGFTGILISDKLPDTLDYLSAIAVIKGNPEVSLATSYDNSARRVTVYISKDQLVAHAGASVVITLNTKVNSSWVSGSITNTALAFYQYGPTPPDPDIDDPDEEDEITVPSESITDLIKTYSNSFIDIGDAISFKLSFTIPVTVDKHQGLLMVDSLPATLTYISASATIGSSALTPSITSGTIALFIDKTTLETHTGDLVTLTINTTVSPAWVSGAISNTAYLYSQPSSAPPDLTLDRPIAITHVSVPNTPIPVTYTVTYSPGSHGTFAARSYSGLAYGTSTPAAPKVTGQAGWLFTGWSPARSSTVTKNVTYTALWARVTTPSTYTVQFIDWDGTLIKSQPVVEGGSATAPPDPTREGYNFTGWNQPFNYVTNNLTVIAQYVEKPVIEPEPEPEPEPEYKPEPESKPEPTDPATPPQPQPKAVWGFLNLVMAITGALLPGFILFSLMRFRHRKRSEISKDYRVVFRFVWLFVAILLGACGVVFLILTEDYSNHFALVDQWTLLCAAILGAEAVALIMASRRRGKKTKQVEDSDEA